MRKHFSLILFSIFLFAVSVQAQEAERYGSSRLTNLAQTLIRQTVDLVDRTSSDMRNNPNNSRADIEAAFLAAQLDGSSHLFETMLRDGRRAGELRDAAAILSDLARRAPNSGSSSFLWRDAQRTISDINRELGNFGGGGGNNGGGNQGGGQTSGRVFWRGKVDIETQLVISGNSLETRVTAGPNWGGESHSFTSPLPSRRVNVEVKVNKGRGSARVIQQPSRNNDFTAIVQILDPQGGARDYELEISWR
jgi:hypothetical protein